MNVKERIKKFIQTQGITVIEFERSINASNGYVNSIHRSIGIEKLNSIIEKYPTLNIEWLLSGGGSMFKNAPRDPCPEEFFSVKVPTPPPEPFPPPETVIDKILRRNEELVAENALLKKEVEDLKSSRGKGPRTISYSAHQEIGIVADPGAPPYSDRHRDK